MSLKHKTVGALSWSFLQEAAQRVIQIAVGIVLARLLAPEAFGLIAMLTVFIAVAQALLSSGFGAALVQRKDLTDVDESSVFYFNLLIGVVLAAGLFVAAPWISAFYKQPGLAGLSRALSLVLVINGFAVVQNALMSRRLDFKRQAIVNSTSTALSGIVGIGLAWQGFGVWSLVGQQLTSSCVRAALYWWGSPWRPRWLFSFRALREMFQFGSGMMASSLLNSIFENLYPLVIGKLFAPATLGYYNRAQALSSAPAQSLGILSNRVLFPVLSRLQGERTRLQSGLRKAITTLAFVQFPLMIGLAVIAEPLVLLLLTDKWAPTIPYFQWLCFVGIGFPLHLANLNALLSVGRSDVFFRLEVIKKVLVVLNIAITYRWGVSAMIIGQIVNNGLAFSLHAYYTQKHVGYAAWLQCRDLCPFLSGAAVMGLAVYFIPPPMAFGHAGELIFKILLGVVIYGGVALLFRFQALEHLQEILRARRAVTGNPTVATIPAE